MLPCIHSQLKRTVMIQDWLIVAAATQLPSLLQIAKKSTRTEGWSLLKVSPKVKCSNERLNIYYLAYYIAAYQKTLIIRHNVLILDVFL